MINVEVRLTYLFFIGSFEYFYDENLYLIFTISPVNIKLLHTIPHGLTLQGNATITGSLEAASFAGANSFILKGQVVRGVTSAFNFGTFVRMDEDGLTQAKADSLVNAEVLGMVALDKELHSFCFSTSIILSSSSKVLLRSDCWLFDIEHFLFN